MTHVNPCTCEHCAGLREARATSDYWRSPAGVTRRIEMLSERFTYQVINNSLMFYGQSAGVHWVRWVTMQDERVCFPAGTRITTLRGEHPIEELQPGDQVLTRKGFKKVLATISRPYVGRMTTIEHEKGTLTLTLDHPVWKVGQGWIAAFQIRIGDFLKTVDNEKSRVSRVFQFGFTDPNNIPPSTNEELGLPNISTHIPMPISPINLQCNPKIGNQEVNTISPNPCLLDIFNFDRIKNLAYRLFQQCFALILTIARKTTELAIRIPRYRPELFTTIPTINIFGWTPTRFTAIPTIQTLFSSKDFAAPLTRNILGIGRSTSPTTDCVPIGDGTINLKCLTTFWTNLLHLLGFRSTRHGTKPFPPLYPSWHQIETNPTLGADPPFTPPLPLRGFGFHQPMINRHNNQPLSPNYLKVFNLEIEDEPEYFANGVLVHNCPICGPLQGRVYRKGQFLPPLPAHANCRCRFELLTTVGPEAPLVQQITLPKATGFEITAPDWHAMVRRESPTRILLLLFTVELLTNRTKRYNELEKMMRNRGITEIELLVGAGDEEAEYWRRRGYKVKNGKLVKKI